MLRQYGSVLWRLTLDCSLPSIWDEQVEDEHMNVRLPGGIAGNRKASNEMVGASSLKRARREARRNANRVANGSQDVVETGIPRKHQSDSVTVAPGQPSPTDSLRAIFFARAAPRDFPIQSPLSARYSIAQRLNVISTL